MPAPRVAIAGAVMAEGVNAVARAVDDHAVREREEAAVEMGGGCGWLQAAFRPAGDAATPVATLVTVAFEVNFFEVKRPVTEAGGFPVVDRNGPATGRGRAACLIDLIPAGGGQVGGQFAAGLSDADS